MGTIIDMQAARDAKITGTTQPARLALIVRLLSVRPDRNSPAQSAKLAAAQRLLNQEKANG